MLSNNLISEKTRRLQMYVKHLEDVLTKSTETLCETELELSVIMNFGGNKEIHASHFCCSILTLDHQTLPTQRSHVVIPMWHPFSST